MRLDTLFHAVKQAGAEEKKAFWKLCKTAASNDAGGVAVGLTKIAYDVWAGSYERGLDPVADQRSREAFASSFGSAYVAESMATKLAEAGQISSDERDYLHAVIAESAVRDLEEMTKSADVQEGLEYGGEPPMNADQSPPPAPEGEAIGAEPDPLAGQTEGLDKAHKVVDNMIFLAQQVQLPQLAQELDQMRDQIAQHFADGHAYLPSELQHHFAQSEHAEAFMKKYKQRFGSPAVGGQKKSAEMSPALRRALMGAALGGVVGGAGTALLSDKESRTPSKVLAGAGLGATAGGLIGGLSGGRVAAKPEMGIVLRPHVSEYGRYQKTGPGAGVWEDPEGKVRYRYEGKPDFDWRSALERTADIFREARAKGPISDGMGGRNVRIEGYGKFGSAQDDWLSWRTRR